VTKLRRLFAGFGGGTLMAITSYIGKPGRIYSKLNMRDDWGLERCISSTKLCLLNKFGGSKLTLILSWANASKLDTTLILISFKLNKEDRLAMLGKASIRLLELLKEEAAGRQYLGGQLAGVAKWIQNPHSSHWPQQYQYC
jgi:hypothetical protein